MSLIGVEEHSTAADSAHQRADVRSSVGTYRAAPVLPRPLSMLNRQSAAFLAVIVVWTSSALDIVTGRVIEAPEE